MVVVVDLRVTEEVVLEEFDFNRGVHLRMSWLWDRYDDLMVAQMYEVVVMVYMLHLVTCNLSVNKSHVNIDAQYMWLFSSLDDTSWA